MWIFKAAVVGAGTMGAGIAQTITYAGLPVVLKDVNQELVDKGLARIQAIYQSRVDKGKLDAHTMREKMDLVIPATSYEEFADVDVVIEAVPEKIELKKQVFRELEEVCPENTIFGSNTSALSISEMGAATRRPHKVIGAHFFFPAHVMKLVEVIPGLETDQDTIDTVVQFSESLRKLPVVVKECPGFLVNRLLDPYLNEAIRCLEEGAATTSEIDGAFVAFGMPMGPFTLLDALGLDIAADVAVTLYEEYGERMKPPALTDLMVASGRKGEKTGAGFYGYAGQSDEPVREAIAEIQRKGGRTGTTFSVERCLLPLINEAVLCLQETIATASDIDLAMMAGTGMRMGDTPMGPLAMADDMGLDVVLEKLEGFHKEYGEAFRPARLLRLKVKAGHLGKKAGKGFHAYT
jgi:3-hydroxyacyl-CoA dehydrogenase